MKRMGAVILLGLLGAGPATESLEQRADRLQGEVESLRRENRRLRAELGEAKRQIRPLVIPRFEGPRIPEGAVPRGEGDVWHYIIPIGQPTVAR